MLNKIQIIGNLGAKPEVTYLSSGRPIAKFSVAVTEKYTNKAGEQVQNTEWFRVEMWGKQAEIVEKYLDKGSRVYIEGKQKTDEYTDKDNVKRRTVKLVGFRLIMLSGRPEKSTENISDQPQQTGQSTETIPETVKESEDYLNKLDNGEIDDNLPF